MGMVKYYNSATGAWRDTLAEVLNTGIEVKPRDMLTREILNNSFAFDMTSPICYHQDRGLSYKFMAAEALWITSGSNSVSEIAPYNKYISEFSDNGEIFNGAYGPPFHEQVPYVVRALNSDEYTRQAVMTIWNRRPESSKDIPCTVALSWNIRQGRLNCHVFMRSSDAWLGLPYDVFNFTMMTCFIASKLEREVKPGLMFMNLVSSHLYERHFEGAAKVLEHLPDKETASINEGMFQDWEYIHRSLLVCRDIAEKSNVSFWRIRP